MKAYSKPIETERVYVEETPGVVLHMSRDEADTIACILNVAMDEDFELLFQPHILEVAQAASKALRTAHCVKTPCDSPPLPYVYNGYQRLDRRDPHACFDTNYWRWDKGCCKWVRR